MTAEIKHCLCVRQCSVACPHLLQMPLMLEHWLYSHTCPRGPPSQQCQRLHAHLSSIPLSLRLNLLSSISSSTCSCECKNKHGGSLRAVKHHRVTAKLKHLIKGRLTSLSVSRLLWMHCRGLQCTSYACIGRALPSWLHCLQRREIRCTAHQRRETAPRRNGLHKSVGFSQDCEDA